MPWATSCSLLPLSFLASHPPASHSLGHCFFYAFQISLDKSLCPSEPPFLQGTIIALLGVGSPQASVTDF